jgi:hypothetical protein
MTSKSMKMRRKETGEGETGEEEKTLPAPYSLLAQNP